MPRTVSLLLPLLVACTVLGVACAARAEDAAQRAVQGAGELLERGKAAVGLGREDPEGRTTTGVSGGVPFLVRVRGTVGGLEPGDPGEVRGMRMGAVREVRDAFDPAAEDFDIPVVVELDPRPFVGGEPGADAPARVEGAGAAGRRRRAGWARRAPPWSATAGSRGSRRAPGRRVSGWSGSTRRPGRA